MTEAGHDPFENRLHAVARAFDYPPTPDIARTVRARLEDRGPSKAYVPRLASAVVVALITIAGLVMAVPAARATVFEALQLGAVRILLGPATPTATALPPTATRQAPIVRPSDTPGPPASPTVASFPVASVLDLFGETTLEEAQASVEFPILLPAYPTDLGPPDRVFLQDFDGPMVVLVWTEPGRPDAVRMSLHILSSQVVAEKGDPAIVTTTIVNGDLAFWMRGPYLFRVLSGQLELRRYVEGFVLLWTDGVVTYRLETDLPLEEAVRAAESLR